ncbi:MAG: redoxin domain-containing protein, partial [Planctomycetes bacterium]|nr:redoxin domain-containing protein [Planctomycetota bacterium]
PVGKNADFAKSLDLDYPILSDPTGEAAKKYGVYNADRNAAQRVTFYIGEDGKILAIDRAVKTDTHGADIATQLGKLGVEKR